MVIRKMKHYNEINAFVDEFKRIKSLTVSNYSHWRFSPDNTSKEFTYLEIKKYIENNEVKYITIYFKGTYWDNIRFYNKMF
jgi:hypothetical protein